MQKLAAHFEDFGRAEKVSEAINASRARRMRDGDNRFTASLSVGALGLTGGQPLRPATGTHPLSDSQLNCE